MESLKVSPHPLGTPAGSSRLRKATGPPSIFLSSDAHYCKSLALRLTSNPSSPVQARASSNFNGSGQENAYGRDRDSESGSDRESDAEIREAQFPGDRGSESGAVDGNGLDPGLPVSGLSGQVGPISGDGTTGPINKGQPVWSQDGSPGPSISGALFPESLRPEIDKSQKGSFSDSEPSPGLKFSPPVATTGDVESSGTSSNGSWTSPQWSAEGVPYQNGGRVLTMNGTKALGMGMNLRGRQSVLGSATMQGSRFEAGHGDASWINSMSPDWFPVIPLWQATEKAAMASEPFLNHIPQAWRVLLLSDGSVTRHLHLLTGHRVSVDCLEMRAIGHSLLGVPPGTALVAGPRVQRQVLLKAPDGTPLAYAASWWAEYEAKSHLSEAHTPIWVALQSQRMELLRSLECLYYGHSRELEKLFGRDGPFWARHYFFYNSGRPLTLIYEVFSPALEEWLGDSSLPDDLYLP